MLIQPWVERFVALAIFDAAEMALYIADIDTHELLYMNSHAERLWGEHKIGQPCYRVLQRGQDQPCSFCNNHLLRDGRTHPVTWEFQNTLNERWYLCIDKAIPWPDGRQVRMEVAIDITERKQRDQFREQCVGLISHDLRTPLSVISIAASTLQMLLQRGGIQEASRQVDAILRNSGRLAEMIDDLLETTRLESGQSKPQKSPFDLGRLAETVAAQLGTTASRSVRLDNRGAAPVLADAGRIERVLENLIGNAFRYSPAGAAIRVCVESNPMEAIVTVTDEGIGIPADELPKLFQPFYRAAGNTTAHGLGLGLYNSRLIVEQHGGRIWVERSTGGGSTFGFALPAVPLQ